MFYLGVLQTSAEPNGALGLIQMVGNFHAVRVNISDQAGQWFISINSAQPYTVKVIGKTPTRHLSFLLRCHRQISNMECEDSVVVI